MVWSGEHWFGAWYVLNQENQRGEVPIPNPPRVTTPGTTMLGAILGQFLLYNFLGEILFFKELMFVTSVVRASLRITLESSSELIPPSCSGMHGVCCSCVQAPCSRVVGEKCPRGLGRRAASGVGITQAGFASSDGALALEKRQPIFAMNGGFHR